MEERINRIKELRVDRGLTQEQLAERLNTTKPQISRLEKKSPASLQQGWLYRIAEVFECHWSELIEKPLEQSPEEKRLINKIKGLSETQLGALETMVDAFGIEHKQDPFKGSDET